MYMGILGCLNMQGVDSKLGCVGMGVLIRLYWK